MKRMGHIFRFMMDFLFLPLIWERMWLFTACIKPCRHLSDSSFARERKRIDINKVETFLGIYQTSSPSYVLMGGISACLRFIKEKGEEAFEEYVDNLKECRLQLSKMKSLRMLEQELGNTYSAFDISKLVISTVGTGISGVKLHDILRGKYHLEMEMEAETTLLLLPVS